MTLIATYSHGDQLMADIGDGLFLPWEIRVVEIILPYAPPVSQPIAYVVFIFTFAVAVLLVISHTLTLRYRHSKQVKASSWKVLQLAFVGSYLLVVSTIAHTLLVGFFPKDVEVRCNLWHVIFSTLSVGFTLVESTMCVLTWRLYRIFVAYKNPGKCLSDRILVSIVFSCILVTVAVSVVWFAADPLRPISDPSSARSMLRILNSRNDTVTGVELAKTQFMYCKSQVSSILWFSLQNTLNFALSVITCVFVYLTRKVPMKQFNTVRLIRLNYIVKGSGLLFTYVYSVLSVNISTVAVLIRFILFTLILNAINSVICALLYLPPLYSLLMH